MKILIPNENKIIDLVTGCCILYNNYYYIKSSYINNDHEILCVQLDNGDYLWLSYDIKVTLVEATVTIGE